MDSVTEPLNLKCYLILINLNVNSHIWLIATIVDSEALGYKLHEDRFCFSFLFTNKSYCLEQCLGHNRCSINDIFL